MAFGLLSSHSRLHGSSSYRVPWVYDDEAVDVLRLFTHLKCRLMPTLFAAAVEAHETGTPVMRAMMLEFPDDPACDALDRQYMLGPNLLIAPVFSEDGVVDYYVPEGRWTHFLTGDTVSGPRWVRETHEFRSVPLLARPRSVVAVGANAERPDYDFADGVTFHVYELMDSGPDIETVVPALDGSPALMLAVSRTGQRVELRAAGRSDNWRVLLVNVADAEVRGGTGESTEDGFLVTPASGENAVFILLP